MVVVKISAKADYAVRLTAELAVSPPQTPVTGPALASAQQAPLAFCENILGLLRTAGIVASRRGAEGGYYLAVPPTSVTVADVIRAEIFRRKERRVGVRRTAERVYFCAKFAATASQLTTFHHSSMYFGRRLRYLR